MLINYLKVAWRNLWKNKTYVLINVFGLSLGLACSIVAYFNWEFDYSFDRNHSKLNEIYKINTYREVEGQVVAYGTTPLPLASFIKSKISGINSAVRYSVFPEIIRKNDQLFRRKIAFTDPGFLKIFDYELDEGYLLESLNKNQIIITKSTAIMLFNTGMANGKTVTLITNDQHEIDFQVVAVIEDHPLNSSFQFEMLANIELLFDRLDKDDWTQITHATFVDITVDIQGLDNQLQPFVDLSNAAIEDWTIERFELVPLKKMAHVARYVRGNYLGQSNPRGTVMIPSIMAITILLIACFNFTNTTIALSGKRLKEIGIRKSIGAQKSSIIIQLLGESILLCFVALGIAMLLAEFLVPAYNHMGPWINLKTSYLDNYKFLFFLFFLVLTTSILSSAYAAFYISSFNVVKILKGNLKFKGTSWFTRTLLIMQISFSLTSVIQGIVYFQNSKYQESFDLGYNKDEVIRIPIHGMQDFQLLRDLASTNPKILETAGGKHHLGYNLSRLAVKNGSDELEVYAYEIGDNYTQTMELTILKGRFFRKNSASDLLESVIINEELAKDLMLKEPLGKRISLGDKMVEVIGIVKNFYPSGLWLGAKGNPILLKITTQEQFNHFLVRVDQKNLLETNQWLKEEWKNLFPNRLFESDYENESIYLVSLLNKNMTALNIFMAILAIILSGTGLYTLVAITVIKKSKEIGVRKVLGASILAIFGLLNRGLLVMVMIAIFLGSVMGFYMSNLVLDLMFAYHINVSMGAMVISSLIILLIMYLTIGHKLFQAASINPVDSLKYE